MKPCQKQFHKAIIERSNYPLPSGAYKLREAAHMLDRFEREITLLAGCQNRKQPLRGNCTYGDHATWLKQLPKQVAELLGYSILPAIRKLDADGVSQSVLQKQLPWFEREINKVVHECDRAFTAMKRGIRHEYQRWERNDSELVTMIYSSQHIVDAALGLLPPTTKTGSGQQNKPTNLICFP